MVPPAEDDALRWGKKNPNRKPHLAFPSLPPTPFSSFLQQRQFDPQTGVSHKIWVGLNGATQRLFVLYAVELIISQSQLSTTSLYNQLHTASSKLIYQAVKMAVQYSEPPPTMSIFFSCPPAEDASGWVVPATPRGIFQSCQQPGIGSFLLSSWLRFPA